MTFGANGVFLFSKVLIKCYSKKLNDWAPHSMGVDGMAHRIKLEIQTFSHLHIMNIIKGLFPHTTIFLITSKGIWNLQSL
jgi:hypothetical protein